MKLSAAIRKAKNESLERILVLHFSQLRGYKRQFRFHANRRWRFDFAWPQYKIAVEAEGGTWIGGAHTRGKHYESDCAKYNTAALCGWMVGRFTTDMIKRGEALIWVEEAILRSVGR